MNRDIDMGGSFGQSASRVGWERFRAKGRVRESVAVPVIDGASLIQALREGRSTSGEAWVARAFYWLCRFLIKSALVALS
jgi:hypothetical protein